MLKLYPIDASLTVTAAADAPPLDAPLERRVEDLWRQEQAKRARPLFNGQLLSVISIEGSEIAGQFVEYRRFVAQRGDPALVAALKIRPLAVSGFLRCRDGIVFGRRSAGTTQDAGRWELVPSGSLDRRGLRPDNTIDIRAKIFEELEEETGSPSSAVTFAEPFLLVEDTESGVVDIGIDLALDLDAEAVLAVHRAHATDEYETLRIVPAAEIDNFMTQADAPIVEVSLALLRARGMLDRHVTPEAVAR